MPLLFFGAYLFTVFRAHLWQKCFCNTTVVFYNFDSNSYGHIKYGCWLVVSTPGKYFSQLGWLFPIYGKRSKPPTRGEWVSPSTWWCSWILTLPLNWSQKHWPGLKRASSLCGNEIYTKVAEKKWNMILSHGVLGYPILKQTSLKLRTTKPSEVCCFLGTFWKPTNSEVVRPYLNVKPSAMKGNGPKIHHLEAWLVHGPSWAIPLTSSWPPGNGISFSQAPAGHGLRKQQIWAAKDVS